MLYDHEINTREYVVSVMGRRDDVVAFRDHFFQKWAPSHDYTLDGDEFSRVYDIDVPSRMGKSNRTYGLEGQTAVRLTDASELTFRFTALVAVANPLADWAAAFGRLIFDGHYKEIRETRFTALDRRIETYPFPDDCDCDPLVETENEPLSAGKAANDRA